MAGTESWATASLLEENRPRCDSEWLYTAPGEWKSRLRHFVWFSPFEPRFPNYRLLTLVA